MQPDSRAHLAYWHEFAFHGIIVVDVQRHDREGLLAITRLPTIAAFETTPCITHPDSTSVILYLSQVRVSWRYKEETLMSEKKVSLLNKIAHPP